MKKDNYWRNPKKARGQNCDAWWYANSRNIEIHADVDARGHCRILLPRKQLAEYLRRSTKGRE